MKESHIEGLAIHDDPESCAGVREGVREALTGACAGTVLSREIYASGMPTLLIEARRKATRAPPLSRGGFRSRAVVDPLHVQNLPAREPGGPMTVRHEWRGGPHW